MSILPKKPVILCVDDEKIVLNSLRTELRNYFEDNYIIETSESGEEAIEIAIEYKAENREVCIVISDYIMPGLKGDVLLKRIKEIFPNCYAILLTGQATTEGIVNAVNWASLYRYIAKPWETNDLLMTIREAIKSYTNEIELRNKQIQLEESNKQLKELDNAKSYFLGLIAHELNTPVNSIHGSAQLLLMDAQETHNADEIELVQYIMISTQRLRRFNDLALLITRICTKEYKLTINQSSVDYLVHIALGRISERIVRKKPNVEINLQFKELILNGDETLLAKAFEIIVDNAIKFSPQNAKIIISDVLSSGNINPTYTVKITDSGCGFSQGITKIFDLFSSDELMHHSDGYGLGLSAAKLIMTAHHGDIKAYNNESGVGATVELIFAEASISCELPDVAKVYEKIRRDSK